MDVERNGYILSASIQWVHCSFPYKFACLYLCFAFSFEFVCFVPLLSCLVLHYLHLFFPHASFAWHCPNKFHLSLILSCPQRKHTRILFCYSTVFVSQPLISAPPQWSFLFYLIWAVVLNITLDCVFLGCALSGFVCPLECFLPLHADDLLFTKNYRAALTLPLVSAPGLPPSWCCWLSCNTL